MTAALKIGEVADSPGEFFAPASTDMVDGLISQYQRDRRRIRQVVEFVRPEQLGSVMHFFIEGNQDRRDRFTGSVARLFDEEGAVAALNAHYWQRALDLTDVLDFMPAKRREEWFEQIQKHETPNFEDATVRATLGELLAQRMNFLAEKVDGIFRALSHTHVTNRPEGFSKRMILTGVTNDWGSYAHSQTGHINDLRQVIAKFMGRDEPNWTASNRLVEIARATFRGEWLDVDGGALRIRCYKNGNAHLETHPEIAWRLNQILAHLHPMAIPSEFRTAPKKKAREFTLMERPLPFAVLNLLGEMELVESRRRTIGYAEKVVEPLTTNPHSIRFRYGVDKDRHVVAEVERVLSAIGGVKVVQKGAEWWEFDYQPGEIIKLITVSGVIPEQKSHQFYPTPAGLATRVVELAAEGAQPGMHWLEPSAGTGALTVHVPEDAHLQCYEISPLHVAVLEAKGFKRAGRRAVECLDFLKLAGEYRGGGYDRILMNPPFSQGRWQAHTEAAAGVLKPGGRLVAILPSSAQGKFHLPGLSCSWQGPFDNHFSGASVSVSILIADREAP